MLSADSTIATPFAKNQPTTNKYVEDGTVVLRTENHVWSPERDPLFVVTCNSTMSTNAHKKNVKRNMYLGARYADELVSRTGGDCL